MPAGGTTSLGTIAEALKPIIKGQTGLMYADFPKQYDQICSVESSEDYYDDFVSLIPLGAMARKDEMQPSQTQSMGRGYRTRITQYEYGTIHRISQSAITYNRMPGLTWEASEHLATAAHYTKELLAALMMDNATTAGIVGGDGQPLASTIHPLGIGGTASNVGTSIALCQTGLEQMLILGRQQVNEAGLPANIAYETLLVATQNYIRSQEILNTEFQHDTANNSVSVIVKQKLLKNIIHSVYLTNPTAYHILANKTGPGMVKNGLMQLESVGLEIESYADQDARLVKVHSFMAQANFWHDWRSELYNAGV